jgi:hypothetical protein
MHEMEIKSAHSGARLRFFELRGDYFRAALTSNMYSGSLKVCAYTDAHGLADLFQDMAANWQGWNGKKVWASIEGEFSLSCTHDKLGHITIDVMMNEDFGSRETWNLRASLVIEAGQLEAIAAHAKEFFGQE